MIRILQIVDNINIDSGVSSIIMNIYENINKDNFSFDFLVFNKSKNSYEDRIKELGGTVYYTSNPLSKNLFKSISANKLFFKNNLDTYDIIQLHSPTTTLMTIRYAKKYHLRNIVVHSHSSMTSMNKIKSFVNYLLTLNIKKYCDYMFYCSDVAGNFLFGKNYDKKNKGFWIPNAINPINFKFDIIKRNTARNEICLNNKIALHISNYSKIKNVVFLVNVIEKVIKKDKSWKFIFIGDGPEKDNLIKHINEKKLNTYCLFLDKTKNVNKYLEMADLFLLPSKKEGLPLVAVESQSCGLPVLLNDTITRQVDVGNCTYLGLDEDKWTNYILNFEPLSDVERIKKGIEFSSGIFNIENTIKYIENIYYEISKDN